MKLFRKIAFIEGVSWLALLLFAMPMKYQWGQEVYVQVIGAAHGALFVLYVFMSIWLYYQNKTPWTKKHLLIVLMGSTIPFGMIYIDKKYLRT